MYSGKKPSIVYKIGNNIYLNVTNKCSNNCWFCIRNFKNGVADYNLKLDQEPTAKEVINELKKIAGLKHWKEIVFCGFGEPTERLDIILEVTKWIKNNFPKSLIVRLDTNGHAYIINKGRKVSNELKTAGVNKVSVSLNGYDEESYYSNCRNKFSGGFTAVIDFIKKAKNVGLDVEVSAVRMPEVNIDKIKKIVDNLGVSFRVRAYIQCFW